MAIASFELDPSIQCARGTQWWSSPHTFRPPSNASCSLTPMFKNWLRSSLVFPPPFSPLFIFGFSAFVCPCLLLELLSLGSFSFLFGRLLRVNPYIHDKQIQANKACARALSLSHSHSVSGVDVCIVTCSNRQPASEFDNHGYAA